MESSSLKFTHLDPPAEEAGFGSFVGRMTSRDQPRFIKGEGSPVTKIGKNGIMSPEYPGFSLWAVYIVFGWTLREGWEATGRQK